MYNTIITLLYIKGNSIDLLSYGPICLLFHIYKLFMKIVANSTTANRLNLELVVGQMIMFYQSNCLLRYVLNNINHWLLYSWTTIKHLIRPAITNSLKYLLTEFRVDSRYINVLNYINKLTIASLKLHKLEIGVRQGDTNHLFIAFHNPSWIYVQELRLE